MTSAAAYRARLSQPWLRLKARLLAVRRRSWILAALGCFIGWCLLLSLLGADFGAWWLLLDAPLNFGWIFCGLAAAGFLTDVVFKEKTVYVVSDAPPSIRRALRDGVVALFMLAFLIVFGAFAAAGMVYAFGGWGWAVDIAFGVLIVVRSYFGVRGDLRARRAAREQWLLEQQGPGQQAPIR